MKAVILAGGRGSRMGTGWNRPKPLLEVGDRPIIEHVMDIYLDAGIKDFVICAGYRFDDFVKWLSSGRSTLQEANGSELSFTLKREGREFDVSLANTGEATMTGGRLRRVEAHLTEPFYLTYADGLADVNIDTLWQTHRCSGASVTVTAIPFAVQYGVITLESESNLASRFQEKPVLQNLWYSGGFFVVEPGVISKYCIDDTIQWEADVLNNLATTSGLAAYRHNGYWASIDNASQLYAVQKTWRKDGALWRIRSATSHVGQEY
jgi:glucose-1-phosphate cytidylyltransferase